MTSEDKTKLPFHERVNGAKVGMKYCLDAVTDLMLHPEVLPNELFKAVPKDRHDRMMISMTVSPNDVLGEALFAKAIAHAVFISPSSVPFIEVLYNHLNERHSHNLEGYKNERSRVHDLINHSKADKARHDLRYQLKDIRYGDVLVYDSMYNVLIIVKFPRHNELRELSDSAESYPVVSVDGTLKENSMQ